MSRQNAWCSTTPFSHPPNLTSRRRPWKAKKKGHPQLTSQPLDQPEKKKIIAPPRRRAWYLEETPVYKVQGMYPGVIIMVETAQLRN